jgi:Fe-S-cluster containining protein
MLMPLTDDDLLQSVDSALAESARRSGILLACRPGCNDCCTGVFPISQLDAQRLRDGLRVLEASDPARAARIRSRLAASLKRIGKSFPGDSATGLLPEFLEPSDESDAFEAAFDSYANDEVCPVLDPTTGTCDLYASRPIPCRTFGPPVKNAEGGLAVCEHCYRGVTPEQTAACEMIPDPDHLEESLLLELRRRTGIHGNTIVAFALRG